MKQLTKSQIKRIRVQKDPEHRAKRTKEHTPRVKYKRIHKDWRYDEEQTS